MNGNLRTADNALDDGPLEPVATIVRKRIGRAVSPATRWRWIRRGIRGGIKLAALNVAGLWMTTPKAFNDFLAATTVAALAGNAPPDPPAERPAATTPAHRQAGLLASDEPATGRRRRSRSVKPPARPPPPGSSGSG